MEFKRNSQFKINHPTALLWRRTAIEDHFLLWSAMIWLGGLIVSLLTIALFYSKIPDQVPLFFSQPWGQNQLGIRNFLFLLPLGLFFCGSLDLIISQIAYSKNRIVSYLLCTSVIIVTILCTLSTLNIIHLVT